MERRKFLLGVGGSAIGGGALLGSGAFTRIQSQRRVKIEVAEDPDAYLGLDACPDSPNSSYTNIDESGHLEIDMSPENPNIGDADDEDARGLGVNSDSFTYFDNLFQICNQGKQAVGVWIQADDNSELDGPGNDYEDDLPRVQFYNTDDPDVRIDSQKNAYVLDVGECKCVGMRVMTKGLEEGDQLLEDDEIVIHADADVSGTPAVPAEDFVTIGRMRGGDGGGAATWETAIASPTSAGVGTGEEAATGDADWTVGETNSFEFSFDGDDTYSLTVTDDGDQLSSIEASDLDAPAENSQFRLQLRGNADGAVEFKGGELNGAALDGMRDDDESFPNVTIATVDLTEEFTASGDFVFEGIDSDERPAIDVQVEEPE